MFTEQSEARSSTPARAYRSEHYIYIKHNLGRKIIRECLNMREMLKTFHSSVLPDWLEPPPTASTRELVNVLHMWDLLMQFRISPKA